MTLFLGSSILTTFARNAMVGKYSSSAKPLKQRSAIPRTVHILSTMIIFLILFQSGTHNWITLASYIRITINLPNKVITYFWYILNQYLSQFQDASELAKTLNAMLEILPPWDEKNVQVLEKVFLTFALKRPASNNIFLYVLKYN